MNELILSITAWEIANGLQVICGLIIIIGGAALLTAQPQSLLLILWMTFRGVKVTELLLRAWHCRRNSRTAIYYLKRAVFVMFRDDFLVW